MLTPAPEAVPPAPGASHIHLMPLSLTSAVQAALAVLCRIRCPRKVERVLDVLIVLLNPLLPTAQPDVPL